jgi:hypothetical protein
MQNLFLTGLVFVTGARTAQINSFDKREKYLNLIRDPPFASLNIPGLVELMCLPRYLRFFDNTRKNIFDGAAV